MGQSKPHQHVPVQHIYLIGHHAKIRRPFAIQQRHVAAVPVLPLVIQVIHVYDRVVFKIAWPFVFRHDVALHVQPPPIDEAAEVDRHGRRCQRGGMLIGLPYLDLDPADGIYRAGAVSEPEEAVGHEETVAVCVDIDRPVAGGLTVQLAERAEKAVGLVLNQPGVPHAVGGVAGQAAQHRLAAEADQQGYLVRAQRHSSDEIQPRIDQPDPPVGGASPEDKRLIAVHDQQIAALHMVPHKSVVERSASQRYRYGIGQWLLETPEPHGHAVARHIYGTPSGTREVMPFPHQGDTGRFHEQLPFLREYPLETLEFQVWLGRLQYV